MKPAVTTSIIDDEFLIIGRQFGATDVVGQDDVLIEEGKQYFPFIRLSLLKKKIEDAGLTWSVMGGVPNHWIDKIVLGLPGRDEQIENFCKTIKHTGAAGIPIMGYSFNLKCTDGRGGLRTSDTTRGRGDARVTSFDYEFIKRATPDYWQTPLEESFEIGDNQMWDNLTYFLKAVIPVAEEAGVKMALHPSDPPISPIAGVARILRSHDALKRVIEIVPSDSNGILFCQGTISEMPENVMDAIRYFGERKKIFFVHFRNVTGTVPKFAETFIDDGYVNMFEAMKLYKEVGFDGPIIDDHIPHVYGDCPGRYRSHAFAVGYIKALIDAVS